ncbi:MAG: nitrous oxide reductase accessory protein NosL [Bacteroidota bacterium]
MKKLIALSALLTFAISCNLRPKEIYYGEDSCHYCSMTIVDKQHAAQLITLKGKVYKYDAAECMIQALTEMDRESVGLTLVTDYNAPSTLIEAQTATFIVSPGISSPMRANLAALPSLEKATLLQKVKQGNLYSWEEIQAHLINR